jgi:hypothetical protein
LLGPVAVWGGNTFAPVGGQYAVIGSVGGDQVLPRVSVGPTGGYLVWQDNATDGDGLGLSARRVDESLSGALGVFRVNQVGTGNQQNPQVAMLRNGGAVFAWQGGPSGAQRIYARFMGADGAFLGGDVLVNTFAQSYQADPALAVLQDGNVVAVWSSYGQDGSLMGVYAQRFTPAGQKLGGEFPIPQTTLYNQRSPALAALPSGGFVVAWVSERLRGVLQNTDETGRDPEGTGGVAQYDVDVYGRLFTAEGVAVNAETQLNSLTYVCANPTVSAAADGTVLVAWSGRPNEVRVTRGRRLEGWDVFGRSFDAQLAPLAPEYCLHTYTYGDQFLPKACALGNDHLVVWTSLNQDGSREGVFGQFVDASTTSAKRERQINKTSVSQQIFPAVASDGQKRVLVAWSSFVGGPASFDLFAQRFSSSPALVAPAPPYVSALSQSRLSVTWPEMAGYPVAQYEVYLDGSTTPVTTKGQAWTTQGLAAGTTHSVRLAYVLADGSRSPLSDATTARTWGDDENLDGLPDDWQALYWNVDQGPYPGADADSDDDGATNREEFLAGTIPTDAASALRLELRADAQGWRLHWNTQPGCLYQVQFSLDTLTWSDIDTQRLAAGAVDSLPVDGRYGVAMYRVIRVR